MKEELRVDVIDTNEVVLDQDLALFRRWDWQICFILQHFDPARLLHENTGHGLRY